MERTRKEWPTDQIVALNMISVESNSTRVSVEKLVQGIRSLAFIALSQFLFEKCTSCRAPRERHFPDNNASASRPLSLPRTPSPYKRPHAAGQ